MLLLDVQPIEKPFHLPVCYVCSTVLLHPCDLFFLQPILDEPESGPAQVKQLDGASAFPAEHIDGIGEDPALSM